MPYLMSNVPYFKCWVRREFTCNHLRYHGEYLHALAIAVNTIPDRSLSFQVVFTGCEIDDEDWEECEAPAAPVAALVLDLPLSSRTSAMPTAKHFGDCLLGDETELRLSDGTRVLFLLLMDAASRYTVAIPTKSRSRAGPRRSSTI